jgi:protein-S-isoprenylcysteine O-methyltransferase Ste14
MALIHSFEDSGNYLFRNRSYFPLILFVFSVPVIYFTDYDSISYNTALILTIIAVCLSTLGFFIRIFSIATTPKGTSGRNTRSGQVADTLNITGIYSIIRHPLYLGNYLMWIGITVFTFNVYFIIIVSLVFWLYYERIMFAEERFLEKKFGQDYSNWSLKVPAFIPSFKNYISSGIPFSFKSVLRREYSGFLATVIGFAFIDHLRYFFIHHKFEWDRISTYILVIAIVLAFVLRTLKHNTNILQETGRS